MVAMSLSLDGGNVPRPDAGAQSLQISPWPQPRLPQARLPPPSSPARR
jgi:hypothetical protein